MSSFSSQWLALREPADEQARSVELLERLRGAFASHRACSVCDLGAGTAASIRALAPYLPAEQNWVLIDHDPELLHAAETRLRSWAERDEPGGLLELRHGGRRLSVSFRQGDISDLASLLPPEVDLITASALLDLVSESWIETLAEELARRRGAVLASLNFDGVIHCDPGHPDDEIVRSAFVAHQRTDKGLGPAAGPDCGDRLAAALRRRGHDVATGSSPWRLDRRNRPLMEAFIEGMAAAVAETGRMTGPRLEAWRNHRIETLATLEVGHLDVLATPPR